MDSDFCRVCKSNVREDESKESIQKSQRVINGVLGHFSDTLWSISNPEAAARLRKREAKTEEYSGTESSDEEGDRRARWLVVLFWIFLMIAGLALVTMIGRLLVQKFR